MYFDERRAHFLKDRLQRRLKACQMDSFYGYYRLLTSREGRAELALLLENLTVNETSFFRNRPQLDLLQKSVLEEILHHKQERRDWNLSCLERRLFPPARSRTPSPFSFAMPSLTTICAIRSRSRCLPPKPLIPPPWKLEIVASDISYASLRTGQEGQYNRTADGAGRLHHPPPLFRKGRDKYSVKPQLKEVVSSTSIT